jgi:outer membrane biosynthesis protein TonB
VDFLLKVPILWISGHDKLIFTDAEKKKLKEYVERGGTILGEACCSKKEFDESFRALVAELWPQSQLSDLPATHPIFHTPRPLKDFRTKVQGCAIASNQGRLGVLYIPNGISCQWERGNASAVPAMDIGANIFFYVDKVASKMKAPEQIEKEHVATKPSAPLPASEQPPADAPKDPVKDAPAETPKDVPAVTPADAPKEAPKEAPKDAPKDEAKDGKDQAAQEEK